MMGGLKWLIMCIRKNIEVMLGNLGKICSSLYDIVVKIKRDVFI